MKLDEARALWKTLSRQAQALEQAITVAVAEGRNEVSFTAAQSEALGAALGDLDAAIAKARGD